MTRRVEQFLDEHHVPYEIVNHDPSATSLQAARAARVATKKLVKCVLLEGDDGFMAALIPADQEIHLGQLNMDYGERVHLAEEAAVRETFADCDPGAVPGLPIAWGVETVWDDALLAQSDIYLEAGDHRRLIHVETRHLKEILADMPHCHFATPRKMH